MYHQLQSTKLPTRKKVQHKHNLGCFSNFVCNPSEKMYAKSFPFHFPHLPCFSLSDYFLLFQELLEVSDVVSILFSTLESECSTCIDKYYKYIPLRVINKASMVHVSIKEEKYTLYIFFRFQQKTWQNICPILIYLEIYTTTEKFKLASFSFFCGLNSFYSSYLPLTHTPLVWLLHVSKIVLKIALQKFT